MRDKEQKLAASRGKPSVWRKFEGLKKPTGYKPLLIMIILFFFQQYTGVYITTFYIVQYFEVRVPAVPVVLTSSPFSVGCSCGNYRLLLPAEFSWGYSFVIYQSIGFVYFSLNLRNCAENFLNGANSCQWPGRWTRHDNLRATSCTSQHYEIMCTCNWTPRTAYLFLCLFIFHQEAGSKMNPFHASILVGLTRFVMSVVTVYLLKKFGRRPLCITSCIGMGTSATISGYYTHKVIVSGEYQTMFFIFVYVLKV